MSVFRWLQRKRQAKGYGVHSPFAFDLITNVIRSGYMYNAFSDIREILEKNHQDTSLITDFNFLSFRLVHHFQAKHILEIHSGKGMNTLFITAPHSGIHCVCIENNPEETGMARQLLKHRNRNIEIKPEIHLNEMHAFDAIFINLKHNCIPSLEMLFELSHEKTFWVIHSIRDRASKQFWRNIVKDKRARTTVDMKHTGIVFLQSSYHKSNYFI